MSLESLFTDRKARKYIKESIETASDLGNGVCDCCGNEGFLLEAFGKHICEGCCERLVEAAEDYDNVFESEKVKEEDVENLLNEGYVAPDFKKLIDDANKKHGGSIPDLLSKDYNIKLHNDWNDRFSQGKIFFKRNTEVGGKTKFNQFMIDYDGQYSSQKQADSVVADADGTLAPKTLVTQQRLSDNVSIATGSQWANFSPSQTVKSTVASPAKPVTQKATKTKKPVVQSTPKASKGNYTVVGDESNFSITVGSGVEVKCTKTSENGNSKVYDVECKGNKISNVVDSEGKGFATIVDKILDNIIGDPSQVLPGFDGIHKDTFSINAYDIYQFVLDKQSFKGQFSVAIFFDGKVRPNNRVYLSDKAVTSRASLIGEITQYMEDSIKKKYPVLFDKHNIVNTSMGKAVFTFKGFDKDGDPVVEAELGNKPIMGKFAKDDSAWTDLSNAEENLRILIDTAIRASNSLIPNYVSSPYYNAKSKAGRDEFDITVNSGKSDEYDIHAEYDVMEFVKTGNVTFFMSVLDTRTGTEQPKEFAKVIYRKAGTPLDTFIKQEGGKIYNHYFSKSNMEDVMTASAREKMKNPSKKQGLFSKIADMFVSKHKKDVDGLTDLEVSSTIDVNSEGKVTSATITVTDPYSDLVQSSRELHDKLGLDKKVNYLKFKKADAKMKDGPSVTYEVKDIQKFSADIRLMILESLILEAFGIVNVNESGRKVFHF